MSKQPKLSFLYPKTIYTFISVHAIFAAIVIYYSFADFKWNDFTVEMVISTMLLVALARWQVLYYTHQNYRSILSFYYAIMLLFGLAPLIIASLIIMLSFDKERPFIKRFFNMINGINALGISYLLFYWMIAWFSINDNMYNYVILIILIAVVNSFIVIINLQFVVYLENKGRIFNSSIEFNIYVSNILNGVITFYLYIALGMVGVLISVLYAILFSIRIRYQSAYSNKKNELYESEQRASVIFDTIDYGIIMLDMDQRIKMVNRVAKQLLERFDSELIGKPLHDVYQGIPIELERMLHLTYHHQENVHHKKVLLKMSGDNLYFDIHTYPQTSSDEKMVGVILLYKNITEEQLIKSQLIEADKLCRIGEIAAEKVHEIKNPLTTVRGYIQFLRHKVAKGKEIKLSDFDVALQEIDRTNEIIQSLLILSKEPSQQKETISIGNLLDEVIQLFQHQLFIKGITLYREVEQDIYLIGVENHLKQIMINLLLNAIDAVSHNKEYALISIIAYDDGCYHHMVVKDNGIGIEKENIEKLKMPFYTTKKNGSGLGLAVTYKLVEEHNGSIHVKSEREKGTEFTVSFPIEEKNCQEDERKSII